MGTIPKGPGGEIQSPAKLGGDTARVLLNSLRRQFNNYCLGHRPVHHYGLIMEGTFTPTGELAAFCRTPCLTVGTSAATVRFSSFRKDWVWEPDIRGMSCRLIAEERLDQPDDVRGRHLDLVTMTSPRFLYRREADFIAAPRSNETLRLLGWAILRRTTFTALWTLYRLRSGRPKHLNAERFFGVHTFWMEKASQDTGVRYHWRPVKPLDPEVKDLVSGLRKLVDDEDTSVAFDLIADVLDDGASDGQLHDPSRRWPAWPRDTRPFRSKRRWRNTTRYVAGRLELNNAPRDPDHPAVSQWVFNPVPTIGGFKASRDEILQARSPAYVASQVERTAE